MAIHLVEKDSDLFNVLELLTKADKVGFDTEFDREKTFYAEIGLFQLEINGEIYLIDPLKLSNFKTLVEVLTTGKFMTIVHAGQEDLSIISHVASTCGFSSELPSNLFDTQLAAAFLNIGSNVGLATLLENTFGIKLAKTETRTDWLARPFTDKQIEYAAMDVAYLRRLSDLQLRELSKESYKIEWLKAECRNRTLENAHVLNPENAYLSVRGASALKLKQLRMLRAVCALRYRFCTEYNFAPSRFIKNDVLLNLVKSTISDPRTYIKQGVHYKIARKYGDLICDTAMKALHDTAPITEPYDLASNIRYLSPIVKKLRKHLVLIAKDLNIDENLLCSRKLLQQFFWCVYAGNNKVTPMLQSSWRKEAVGDLKPFIDLVLEAKEEAARKKSII